MKRAAIFRGSMGLMVWEGGYRTVQAAGNSMYMHIEPVGRKHVLCIKKHTTNQDLVYPTDFSREFQACASSPAACEVAKSPAFHALMKESEQRYADGGKHWAYKEMITNGAKMCAAKFIDRWAGRVRNVNLNAEENFQMMFMQLMILNP